MGLDGIVLRIWLDWDSIRSINFIKADRESNFRLWVTSGWYTWGSGSRAIVWYYYYGHTQNIQWSVIRLWVIFGQIYFGDYDLYTDSMIESNPELEVRLIDRQTLAQILHFSFLPRPRLGFWGIWCWCMGGGTQRVLSNFTTAGSSVYSNLIGNLCYFVDKISFGSGSNWWNELGKCEIFNHLYSSFLPYD